MTRAAMLDHVPAPAANIHAVADGGFVGRGGGGGL